MMRRSFLSYLIGAFTAAAALGQQKAAITEKGKAVVCEQGVIKCPLGHETCKQIDAPIVVGNDNANYPDYAQLYAYHIFCCDQCGIFFTLKQ